MGAIKDIVDLAKDLESRAKDRHDMDTIHKIQSLAFDLQGHYAESAERDVRLIQENAKLKQQLEEAQAEEIRFTNGLEFRKSKRTGNQWLPFCLKCHAPALHDPHKNDYVLCTACSWISLVEVMKLPHIVAALQ